MLRKIVETIVSGTIGLGALYLVAKVAYAEGREAGSSEEKKPAYENSKKSGRLASIFGKGKRSIFDDAEVHITISKKREKSIPFNG